MECLIEFDACDLLDLLKHYTAFSENPIPMDSKVREVLLSAYLNRMIGLFVEGSWDAPESPNNPNALDPLHIRYAGKRTLTWAATSHEEPVYRHDEEVRF